MAFTSIVPGDFFAAIWHSICWDCAGGAGGHAEPGRRMRNLRNELRQSRRPQSSAVCAWCTSRGVPAVEVVSTHPVVPAIRSAGFASAAGHRLIQRAHGIAAQADSRAAGKHSDHPDRAIPERSSRHQNCARPPGSVRLHLGRRRQSPDGAAEARRKQRDGPNEDQSAAGKKSPSPAAASAVVDASRHAGGRAGQQRDWRGRVGGQAFRGGIIPDRRQRYCCIAFVERRRGPRLSRDHGFGHAFEERERLDARHEHRRAGDALRTRRLRRHRAHSRFPHPVRGPGRISLRRQHRLARQYLRARR